MRPLSMLAAFVALFVAAWLPTSAHATYPGANGLLIVQSMAVNPTGSEDRINMIDPVTREVVYHSFAFGEYTRLNSGSSAI